MISLDKLFPTGTAVGLDATTSYTDSSLYSDTFVSNRLGVSVTQALLQGRDVRVNLARINQAAIDTQISEYELRGFTEVLVQDGRIGVLGLRPGPAADRDLHELAESGRTADGRGPGANHHRRARRKPNWPRPRRRSPCGGRTSSTPAAIWPQARLSLLRLLNPSETINWDTDIVLEYLTELPDRPLDPVEQHVQVALKMRPDLNQARLLIRRGELDVVRTRNGLLPRLDAFITYGKTGYARTFSDATDELDEQELRCRGRFDL